MDDKPTKPGMTREWGEGPEGDKDVLAYINETPLLLSLLYDLDLMPEQHPDHESKAWEQIFTITNHWREANSAPPDARGESRSEVLAPSDAAPMHDRLHEKWESLYLEQGGSLTPAQRDAAFTEAMQALKLIENAREDNIAAFGKLEQATHARGLAEGMEEAARVCDDEWIRTSSLCRSSCAGDLARAIRARINAAGQVALSAEPGAPEGPGHDLPCWPVDSRASRTSGADAVAPQPRHLVRRGLKPDGTWPLADDDEPDAAATNAAEQENTESRPGRASSGTTSGPASAAPESKDSHDE